MSAIQITQPAEAWRPSDAEEPRRPQLVLVASAFSECTCPGDCDRDHDNE